MWASRPIVLEDCFPFADGLSRQFYAMNELRDPGIFQAVLQSLGIGVCLVGKDMKLLFWNSGAERITGYMSQEVLGHFCQDNILSHCNSEACDACAALCPFTRPLQDASQRKGRVQLRHKEGHQIPVRVQATPIRSERGVIGVAVSFDEQKLPMDRDQRQHNLAAYGCMDHVTGLPNHSFTNFHLNENLASFAQYHLPFGVVFVEIDQLDGFRLKYGRAAADAISRIVAQTVRHALRPSDFLGRWEDNQLLALMLHCDRRGVHIAGERVSKVASCAGLRWWGDELLVTTSVGDASAEVGDTADSLLARARRALQHNSSSPSRVGQQDTSTGICMAPKPD